MNPEHECDSPHHCASLGELLGEMVDMLATANSQDIQELDESLSLCALRISQAGKLLTRRLMISQDLKYYEQEMKSCPLTRQHRTLVRFLESFICMCNNNTKAAERMLLEIAASNSDIAVTLQVDQFLELSVFAPVRKEYLFRLFHQISGRLSSLCELDDVGGE